MKVFGIGLNKTGGTSLCYALNCLGYNSIHSLKEMFDYSNEEFFLDTNIINNFDAITDTPLPLFYKELDKAFPKSKFILTLRDNDSWLKSTKKHFSYTRAVIRKPLRGEKLIKYLEKIYGKKVFDEEFFLKAYADHENSVRDYFKNREEDILYFNLCGGEGWEVLCSFLNKPLLSEDFPHKNKKTTLKNRVLSC